MTFKKKPGTKLKSGPKEKQKPADAAEQIEKLAGHGWGQIGIAKKLGCSVDTLRKWLDEDEELREAMASGREAEHQILWGVLMRAAMNGNITAAMCLLNARHNYRTDQSEQGNRVSINFTLPGALSMADFQKAIEVKTEPAVPANRLERK